VADDVCVLATGDHIVAKLVYSSLKESRKESRDCPDPFSDSDYWKDLYLLDRAQGEIFRYALIGGAFTEIITEVSCPLQA
jgi:hypothetical protein